jgi:hypothetical protein
MTPLEAFDLLHDNVPARAEYRKQAWQTLKSAVFGKSPNTGSPKLPRFEELWDAYCDEYKFGDDASEHETCLSFYDIIARQLRAGA